MVTCRLFLVDNDGGGVVVAADDRNGLAGLVAIEAREGGDHQFVAAADLQLVHGEEGEIAVCFLRLEFVEYTVGDEHGLGVVQVQCC